ncbi:hypothetical protein T11_8517 [Trichinella zimbabwensis]|uniref:Uncharacterized protein n=1 Tax=Trichinella zimbabwensis TaxID=268475 RepID=A0A0V1GU27_9BILA|nr:hypothetical protein T11_8517 [Trichinella zimbabwensis]
MDTHSVDLVKGGEIKSRKNLCLLSVLNTSYSRTCLPENVCKFLFHCYVYAYVALVSMVAGVRCAVRFYFFKLAHLHLEKREYKIYMKAVMASVFAHLHQKISRDTGKMEN